MGRAPCKLCGVEADLQQSHVVPAFVFRWLKKSAPTPHLRGGQTPNRRVQDGPKKPWLCKPCEQRFSVWENKFADLIFYPYLADSKHSVCYGSWLLKLCVSVSWRTLLWAKEEDQLKHFDDQQRLAAEKALETWRAFLLDEVEHPGLFRQELLPVDIVETFTGLDIAANFNQYLARAVDFDVICGTRSAYTFSKLGRFLIFGHVLVEDRRAWDGSQVRKADGWISPRRFRVPKAIFEYLNHKAALVAKTSEQLSSEQNARIEASVMANLDKIAGTDWWRAFCRDLEMR